jgi:hypothetical protein
MAIVGAACRTFRQMPVRIAGYPFILGGAPSSFPTNGTSASTPLWAGLIAVLNAALGESVGFINPVIYALSGTGFRDILPEPGAADNSFGGVAGYPVTPGWDAVTGWGSPQGVARRQRRVLRLVRRRASRRTADAAQQRAVQSVGIRGHVFVA